LKVIRGAIAPRFFKGKGAKRGGGKPSGHRYGDQVIGYVEARYKIYKVAYEWMLEHRVADLIEEFVAKAFEGVPQYFHDLGDNSDINNTELTVAHSSFVVQHVNRLCAERAGRE
jgi:hypothetical protein